MQKKIVFLYFLFFVVSVNGQVAVSRNDSIGASVILRGTVCEKVTKKPIESATILLKDINKWTFTNDKGKYIFSQLPRGKYIITIYCLGYQLVTKEVLIQGNNTVFDVDLDILSLGLEEIVVTAEQSTDEQGTSFSIEREAIEHAQISSLSEITSLLPGGQTSSSRLVGKESSRIALRSEKAEDDDPSFGTVVEVDGIRLSNNSDFEIDVYGDVKDARGIDSRIISTDNIERVEVLAGIPSVENGDLTSGVIRITTKQGVMPLSGDFSATPGQKEISLQKGIKIKENGGVVNFSYNYTKSISDLTSPYTTYVRNAYNIKHKKVFGAEKNKPLILNSTIAGNVGGYNSENDPDNFKNTYEKKNAFNIRAGIDMKWNIDSRLISELTASANINYSNKLEEKQTKESSASGTVAFHGIEEGYFVAQEYDENEDFSAIQLIDRGEWYEKRYHDSKPLNYNAKIKLKKSIKHNKINNNIMLGCDFSGMGNEGKGLYYGNRPYTPTWREHCYSEEPYLNNLALYAEENFKYDLGKKRYVSVTAGLRNDYSFVKDSKYSNVNALSPRFNIKYQIIDNKKLQGLKTLSCYGGWGKSVKLPSFSTLYVRPSYTQRLAFVPASLADGTTYAAYYIHPNEVIANKSLKWESSNKFEIGVSGKFKQIRFSLNYYNTTVKNRYTTSRYYTPFTYYLTTQDELSNVSIPYENRQYEIDEEGTVTVIDKTGALPNEVLDKMEKRMFQSTKYADNGSPVYRHGLEWVIDFGKIKPIGTSIHIDGTYYYYKYIDHKITPVSLGDNQLMSDGSNYQYIGYYYGGYGVANGSETKRLRSNATFITHIPKLKLVVTLRFEGTFIDSEQLLSEMPDGERSFELDKTVSYLPQDDRGSIYEGNNYVGTYPLYYSTFDDMDTKIPFREKFIWASENDPELYRDLKKLVNTTSHDYLFLKDALSFYYTININISKEIGKRFKLTFYARNFLNNMSNVTQKRTNTKVSLLNSNYITSLNYGISINVKL